MSNKTVLFFIINCLKIVLTYSPQIVVHLTDDLLSRASMTVVNGRPTLTINITAAREQWLQGILRHEIGMFAYQCVPKLRLCRGKIAKKYLHVIL